jgi:hypothetical protein
MSNTNPQAFPHSKTEALAMLWISSRDLSKLEAPEEIVALYQETFNRIAVANKVATPAERLEKTKRFGTVLS